MSHRRFVLVLLALAAGPALAQSPGPDRPAFDVDLDGDGAPDVAVGWANPYLVPTGTVEADACAASEASSDLTAHPAPGLLVAAADGVPLPLHPGDTVGPELDGWTDGRVTLSNRLDGLRTGASGGCVRTGRITWHGPWGASGEHLLGVALDTPEGRRYGWLRVRLDPRSGAASLAGYGLAPALGVAAVAGEDP